MSITKVDTIYYTKTRISKNGYFRLNNRRYLGNKYKLMGFIEDIISKKCGKFNSFCDIFAGTGVVGETFNTKDVKIISNNFLKMNYTCIKAFLSTKNINEKKIISKIAHLNKLQTQTVKIIFQNTLVAHISQ